MLTGIKAWLLGRSAQGMREASVRCANPQGLHRMRYTEWGDRHNPKVLVCVHGLTRNGRDFDDLAQALAPHYRVLCPDVAGRGRSDWLPDKSGYGLPQYVSDMMVLLARSGAESVHWLGTSMGGLIGMLIAAQRDSPITRLVLNDVGPVITAASLRRIGEYVGRAPAFPDRARAEAYIRAVSAPFGPLTDAQWRHLTDTSLRPLPGGGFEVNYDPGIGDVFRATPVLADLELWPIYDAIRCPTLALRGETSDLLTPEVHREMGRRGPMARLEQVPGVGHAPMLMDAAQIALVKDYLLGD
ncbi:alpha/beta hydrolase [Niveibacterium sp. 24ML]|uniref:alpha/beta fold hydrolase n=1 Tax=Niveibacterium sp. 24ML TaxID=2985512 RepID=UPI00226F0F48|nr:alpha/beta hydrolase [Niveibacterium sp. 24ML]MCX9158346.1 alpha/beta hydrolase [Niveibacterium sp. 24ML]